MKPRENGVGETAQIVTASPDWQTYPRTITIDFGDGCWALVVACEKEKLWWEVTDNISM
ncbi:MAG: hypothetical protein R2788_22685 [Saprospiraceae bacterium]